MLSEPRVEDNGSRASVISSYVEGQLARRAEPPNCSAQGGRERERPDRIRASAACWLVGNDAMRLRCYRSRTFSMPLNACSVGAPYASKAVGTNSRSDHSMRPTASVM